MVSDDSPQSPLGFVSPSCRGWTLRKQCIAMCSRSAKYRVDEDLSKMVLKSSTMVFLRVFSLCWLCCAWYWTWSPLVWQRQRSRSKYRRFKKWIMLAWRISIRYRKPLSSRSSQLQRHVSSPPLVLLLLLGINTYRRYSWSPLSPISVTRMLSVFQSSSRMTSFRWSCGAWVVRETLPWSCKWDKHCCCPPWWLISLCPFSSGELCDHNNRGTSSNWKEASERLLSLKSPFMTEEILERRKQRKQEIDNTQSSFAPLFLIRAWREWQGSIMTRLSIEVAVIPYKVSWFWMCFSYVVSYIKNSFGWL